MVLAIGEQAFEFEHRDLHQGNILIKKVGKGTSIQACIKDCPLRVQHSGIEVVLIDFTFSRLSPGDGQVIFYDLSSDLDLFDGPKFNLQVIVALLLHHKLYFRNKFGSLAFARLCWIMKDSVEYLRWSLHV